MVRPADILSSYDYRQLAAEDITKAARALIKVLVGVSRILIRLEDNMWSGIYST